MIVNSRNNTFYSLVAKYSLPLCGLSVSCNFLFLSKMGVGVGRDNTFGGFPVIDGLYCQELCLSENADELAQTR